MTKTTIKIIKDTKTTKPITAWVNTDAFVEFCATVASMCGCNVSDIHSICTGVCRYFKCSCNRLQRHLNKDVQASGCAVLSMLAQGDDKQTAENRALIVGQDGVSAVVEALREHEKH